MKKFLKSIVGIASVAAVTAGAYYFTRKWMEEKDEELEEDFEDLDFDEEEDSREYVTLEMEEEKIDEFEEKMKDISEEDISENDSPTPDVESEGIQNDE